MALAMSRAMANANKSVMDIMGQTSPAWHASVLTLLSDETIDPIKKLRLDLVTSEQLQALVNIHEAVGAVLLSWEQKQVTAPWSDDQLYHPTLKLIDHFISQYDHQNHELTLHV